MFYSRIYSSPASVATPGDVVEASAEAASAETLGVVALVEGATNSADINRIAADLAALQADVSPLKALSAWAEEHDHPEIDAFDTRLTQLETDFKLFVTEASKKPAGGGGQFESKKVDIARAAPASPTLDTVPGQEKKPDKGSGMFRRL